MFSTAFLPRLMFILAVMSLAVCVIYIVVFEHQSQVILNTTVFGGGPRGHILL
jgi:hypothetical protein